MLFIFSTPELIGHLWQLKTAVLLHWCLICAVPLELIDSSSEKVKNINFLKNGTPYIYVIQKSLFSAAMNM